VKQPRAHGTGRLGRTLVTAQVAISMLLVVGATLFVGTLVRLHRIQPGFDSRDVLVVELRSTGSTPVGQRVAAVTGLVERLQALPGVERASVAQVVPISGNDWTRPIELPAEAERPGESETAFNVIGPSYFATLRTPVVAGREFDRRDRSGAEPVAVVNERFARDFFGDRSPLGRHVTSLGVRHEIVGVVGDAMYEDLRQGFRRTMYVPWTMRPEDAPQSYKLLVRTDGHSSALPRARLERLVREVSPDLRVRAMEPYATILDRSMPAERILATLGGLFGGLALSMAAIGLFALLAFQTRRRTNELGVRFVLGATRRSVIGLVARDVAWMLVPGLVIGGGAAWLLSGLARGLLSGMAPGDPVTFGFSAAALGMAAVVAAWLPATRAARIDPLDALRQE
jgi:predicted permease